MSALFYLQRSDVVRTYVSPTFRYNWTETAPMRTTSSGFSTGGVFGVQYVPVRRFGLFGETGVNYGRNEGSSSVTSSIGSVTTTTTTVSDSLTIRSAAGVIFFF